MFSQIIYSGWTYLEVVIRARVHDRHQLIDVDVPTFQCTITFICLLITDPEKMTIGSKELISAC